MNARTGCAGAGDRQTREKNVSDETQMLVVAAYAGPEAAQEDFDALAGMVRAKEVRTQGMILVAKDADGKIVVADTGNHVGRKGPGGVAAWACS